MCETAHPLESDGLDLQLKKKLEKQARSALLDIHSWDFEGSAHAASTFGQAYAHVLGPIGEDLTPGSCIKTSR